MNVLLMPGIYNSGPAHWQSLWEKADPSFRRIDAGDWDNPVCTLWVEAIDRAVTAVQAPLLIVAHSLGCLAVVEWAMQKSERNLRGLMLVSVPDPDGPRFPAAAHGFLPPQRRRLPCESIVVSSEDDPYGSQAYHRQCAESWGSRFVNAGAAGHINADSGLGKWEPGLELLEALRR